MSQTQSTILVARSYGQPEVLEFLTQPLGALNPDEVRIAVRAAGINPIDAKRMTGQFKHGGLPQTFGTEFAGTIIEAGSAAKGWAVGDEVLGSGGAFTHATTIIVPIANLVRKPATIAWDVAGSIAGTAQTAATLLEEIGQARSLLIHGGSGGVGSILTQLAAQKGLKVVATASQANQAYLAQLGATPVVYGEGVTDRIRAIQPDGFDAVIDMAGIDGATALANAKPDAIIGSITGLPATSPRIKPMWVKKHRDKLQPVVDGIAAGRIHWEVSRDYPFTDARQAYGDVLTGHTRGKSVLVF